MSNSHIEDHRCSGFQGHDAESAGSRQAFRSRLGVDVDKPVSWEGGAPEHIVVIQFDNPDQAQA